MEAGTGRSLHSRECPISADGFPESDPGFKVSWGVRQPLPQAAEFRPASPAEKSCRQVLQPGVDGCCRARISSDSAVRPRRGSRS